MTCKRCLWWRPKHCMAVAKELNSIKLYTYFWFLLTTAPSSSFPDISLKAGALLWIFNKRGELCCRHLLMRGGCWTFFLK
ncbi:hypothetical protein GDO81_028822 [Engystomops pustulosus]|uniref:Uncharacterized protein n=1 Tax=Engystomops pustulosus TaxID=76066 RepID=A0AAV6YJE8_ENGPU|nr:hypothetical protein GDO81_028822 [Engystomops pustulosus]